MQGVVQGTRQFLRGLANGGHEVGPAYVPNEQCVAGQYRNRLGRLWVLENEKAHTFRSVSRRGEGLHAHVAQLKNVAIRKP